MLSTHDFDRRPADLLQRVEAMSNEPACSVIKIAWQARSLRDNLEALDLVADRTTPMVVLCMGEFGLMSRVLAAKSGALLTYASAGVGAETAPGQPTIDDLLGRYRFDRIGPATAVYGVIGWPVAQSLSPVIHNAGFEKIGDDATDSELVKEVLVHVKRVGEIGRTVGRRELTDIIHWVRSE